MFWKGVGPMKFGVIAVIVLGAIIAYSMVSSGGTSDIKQKGSDLTNKILERQPETPTDQEYLEDDNLYEEELTNQEENSTEEPNTETNTEESEEETFDRVIYGQITRLVEGPCKTTQECRENYPDAGLNIKCDHATGYCISVLG